MTKKSNTKDLPKKSFLTRSKDEMTTFCEEQVKKGKAIVDMPVRIIFGDDSYGKTEILIGENEANGFIAAKKKWIIYVEEYLKQSFDNPDNEYLSAFAMSGVPMVVTSGGDFVREERDELRAKVDYLEALKEMLSIIPSASKDTAVVPQIQPNESKKVFVVHGHDGETRSKVELLVKNLGFDPIVLFKQPSGGKTIIEKLETETSDVAFAIVLYTGCDMGRDKNSDVDSPRARQNVVFEHGYLCARLGRNRVCALLEKGVEQPGDLSGVIYIPLEGGWDFQLAKEMKKSGLDIDLNRLG